MRNAQLSTPKLQLADSFMLVEVGRRSIWYKAQMRRSESGEVAVDGFGYKVLCKGSAYARCLV